MANATIDDMKYLKQKYIYSVRKRPTSHERREVERIEAEAGRLARTTTGVQHGWIDTKKNDISVFSKEQLVLLMSWHGRKCVIVEPSSFVKN